MKRQSGQKAASLLLVLTMAAGLALPVLAEGTPETADLAAEEAVVSEAAEAPETAAVPETAEPEEKAEEPAQTYGAGSTTGTYGVMTYTVNSDGTTCSITGCDTSASGELVIPETIDGYTVTSIGSGAFFGCSNLTSITLPGGVTGIGSSAFSSCSSLASITIPEGVTSIGSFAFSSCSSLKSITIPEGVTSIGNWTFSSCSSLTNITIPDGVTSIDNSAFISCSSLTSITVTEGNQCYASQDGVLFNKDKTILIICPAGKSGAYTIPDGVTSIGNSAFSNCSNLTSITIPDGVASIGSSAFSGCSSLTSITIPDGVTNIGSGAFSGCSSLISITIPNGVTMIWNYTFSSCSSLTSVAIPNSVTGIGYEAFWGCSSLTSITIPDSVTSIGEYVFGACTSLTSVTIPNRVTSIKSMTFYGCSGLTSITIPYSVTSIGDSAFCYCSSLTSITIPNSVTSIGDASFDHCRSLTSITIPDSVTSIGKFAFSNCDSLVAITVSDGNELYSSLDGALLNKEKTELIVCPEGKSGTYTVPNSVTSIKDSAFAHCTNLTGITIPNVVTSIGQYAFTDCFALTSITIPDSVTSIGNHAFYNCTGSNRTGLRCILLPKSVTSIGSGVLEDCNVFTDVYYTGSEADRNNIDIGDQNNVLLNATWHYNHTGPIPTATPVPTAKPTATPTAKPTVKPTAKPTAAPTATPTAAPTAAPTAKPTAAPTAAPIDVPVSGTGWQTINGKDYWYENGVKQGTTGRGKEIYDPDSDAWYWLDAVQGGAKAVSKDVYQESSGGKWVRYDENGHMVKGWQTTDAGTYYFDLITGAMAKGDVVIDGLPCAFDGNTGIGLNQVWKTIDGKDYWYENGQRQGYDPNNAAYRGKEIYDPGSNGWYWLDNVQQGAKAVSKDVYQESAAGQWAASSDGTGKWVRYDADGHMVKGWQTTSAGTYYFDLIYGTMAKGTVTIDGQTYHFDENTGVLK